VDWTGCPEFAVNFRIAAIQAFFAQVDVVLHAGIAGFLVGVLHAVTQILISFVAGPSRLRLGREIEDSRRIQVNPHLLLFTLISGLAPVAGAVQRENSI
jgi:hypothetical protein